MSTDQKHHDSAVSDAEQDLLDVAAMDVPSADVARRALIAEYGYSEGELP